MDRDAYLAGARDAQAQFEALCRTLSSQTAERPLRWQHHQGAAIAADLCADRIRDFDLLTLPVFTSSENPNG